MVSLGMLDPRHLPGFFGAAQHREKEAASLYLWPYWQQNSAADGLSAGSPFLSPYERRRAAEEAGVPGSQMDLVGWWSAESVA